MTLRKAREFRDLTQQEVADAIGVNVNTYCSWEKCPAKIRIDKLLQITEKIGCRVTDIKLFFDNGSVYVDVK